MMEAYTPLLAGLEIPEISQIKIHVMIFGNY